MPDLLQSVRDQNIAVIDIRPYLITGNDISNIHPCLVYLKIKFKKPCLIIPECE